MSYRFNPGNHYPVVLCFGGGVDSSVLLKMEIDALRQNTVCFGLSCVVFSNTGAEFRQTYRNVARFRLMCAEVGLPFHEVSQPENLLQWVTRLGNLPVLPGAAHACSVKFKAQVIERFIAREFNCPVNYIIGIEANETTRGRFQKPEGVRSHYHYPLIDMGMSRSDCERYLLDRGLSTVRKSSCFFCPYMSYEEIAQAVSNDAVYRQLCDIEHRFRRTSRRNHKTWLRAGRPLSSGKRKRAPTGMWQRDSYADGQRLFAKTYQGQRLTVEQWRAHFARKIS